MFNVEDIENNTCLEEFDLKIWNLMHYESFKTMTSLKKLNIVSRSLDDKQIDDLKRNMPQCKIEVSLPEVKKDRDGGDSTEEEEYISYAEPMEKVYIGDVRIESYYLNEDFWVKRLYIKNFGDEPVESLTEFLRENGFTDGISQIYISYPERDGEKDTNVIEVIEITENGFDYDNCDVYVSAFSVIDEDYVNNCRYRTLVPGCEAEVLLHPDDDDSETE
ncbi:MAG: hypothetical protein K2J72_08400 [Oscillospiraceae bacterium]|nr:hypothetical protein [Oscillospiraceae bacterium]